MSEQRTPGVFARWLAALLAGAPLSLAWPAAAGAWVVDTQLRQVRSVWSESSTGYTCLDGGIGPPLPACPVDLGTSGSEDVQTAPDEAPFDATATTPGGSASQVSSLATTRIQSSGSVAASGSASESMPGAPYVLVVDISSGEVRDRFQTSFVVDQPSSFVLSATGQLAYPDPAFPLVWNAALQLTLSGPGGEIATLSALPDPGCTPDESSQCTLEATPLSLQGSFAPGTYTLDVQIDASASGTWIPSVGPLPGFASGAYTLDLELLPGSALPVLGPAGHIAIALCLLAAGRVAVVRRRG